MSEQELPPGVCHECYRTNGEHATDCSRALRKDEASSEQNAMEMKTADIDDLAGIRKEVDQILATLGIITIEDYSLINAKKRGREEEYYIELGKFALKLQHFSVEVSRSMESLLRWYMTHKDTYNETRDQVDILYKRTTALLEKVKKADECLRQQDVGGLDESCDEIFKEIEILKGEINRIN
ncbi:MAG: hypothetical protein WC289_04310 [Patescibacteria group bacterium]|jgi:hypothetical protein